MKRKREWIHKKKKRGESFSEQQFPEEIEEQPEEAEEEFIEESAEPFEEEIEEPEEAVEEKIGVEPVPEEAVVLRPLKIRSQKRSFRTIRKRRKIGGELIEKEFKEQKARIKKQIEGLPKEHRKAFLEELIKNIKWNR